MVGKVAKTVFFIVFFMGFGTFPATAGPGVEIAAIYALTGQAAYGNAKSLLGVRVAVEEINAKGGILGMPVALTVYDNMSTPIGSSFAAEKAVSSNAVVIVGPAWSSHSIAVARVAQKSRMPMITSYSTNPEVTRIGDCIFRVCFTDRFQGKIMASLARHDLNAGKAVVFTELTSDYSIELSRIFIEHFERMGGEVLLELEYKLKQKNLDAMVEPVKRAAPDVVFFSGHDETGVIVKKLGEAGCAFTMLGGDGWADESFFRKGGDTLASGYYSSHWVEGLMGRPSPGLDGKKRGFDEFGIGAALAYDAVMLAADAITRAGSTDRAKTRNALAETKNFQGVTGAISFDENGDPEKNAVVMRIENGKPFFHKLMTPP